MLKVLKLGSTGSFVLQWQTFLRGQGFLINTSGSFDAATEEATRRFQRKARIDDDSVVGNETLGKAVACGLELVDYAETERSYPPLPFFSPMLSQSIRQQTFGPLAFTPAPTRQNPEAIRITNGWDSEQIVRIVIPQLIGKEGARPDGLVACHRKIAGQLQGLWQAWADHGLLDRVLSYAGAWNPRFVRGKADEQVLSNHAFGTAFDINAPWNRLGAEPATAGSKCCVYELVPLAHTFGFYWGGHFTRRDGMHFEIAVLQ